MNDYLKSEFHTFCSAIFHFIDAFVIFISRSLGLYLYLSLSCILFDVFVSYSCRESQNG